MGTCTITGKLQRPNRTAITNEQVKVWPSTTIENDDGNVLFSGAVTATTDLSGAFTLTLVSPGPGIVPAQFYYTIASRGGAFHPLTFAPAQGDSTVAFTDLVPVTPSPIPSVDAAQLQAQIDALVASGGASGLPVGGMTGQTLVKQSGTNGDAAWTTLDAAAVGALPDTYTPDLSGYATTAALTSGLAGKADTADIPTTAADVGALPDTTAIPDSPDDIGAATAAQGVKADSAVQTVNNTAPDVNGNVTIATSAGSVASTGITDSTAVGRDVLTAADAAAARSAIGAGTSNLTLGTTSTTAKAGDWTPDLSAYAKMANLPAPSDGQPRTLGSTSPGTGTAYARWDHVHAMPTAADVGADPLNAAADAVAAHIAATDPHGDRAYTDAQITALVGGAPGLLDTLGEIAAQLANDEDAAAALTTAVNARLVAADNLSDLTDTAAARTNLGLGTAATTDAGDYATTAQGSLADSAVQPAQIEGLTPLPDQSGNAGKILGTDGTTVEWTTPGTVDASSIPQPLGVPSPGVSEDASPADHVHEMPALADLTDQDMTGIADGTVPTWDATAGKFKQAPPPTGGGEAAAAPVPLWQSMDNGVITLPRGHTDDSDSFGSTPPSGTEHFTFFRADKSLTVNTIRFQTGGTAAAESTIARVGLYTVDAGTVTLIASCDNKTTFTGTYAGQNCALTAPYDLVAGTVYAVGIIQMATTPASLLGNWFNGTWLGGQPPMSQTKGGQTDLAATANALGGNQFAIYYELVT